MIKKHKKLIFVFLILIFVCIVDFTLALSDKRPIFVVGSAIVKDGGTQQYYGLGYKVIGWKRLSTKQINGKEVNGRLTGYEISIFPFFQDLNQGPKKELMFVPNN